ncbi:14106_t:CDS:2, partial [Dentiscutata erythropus]
GKQSFISRDETPLQSNNSEASVKTHISADNGLSQYLPQAISDHTDDKITPIPEESVIRSYALLPEVDTEIIPKVSDDEINKDMDKVPCHSGDAFGLQSNNMLDAWIKPDALSITPENVTSHFARWENNIPAEPKSHPQISVGGIEAIPDKAGMRFRGGHKFKKSDIITLELEPSNTYDKNAIKVMVDGTHKAYVAMNENVSIGDLMKKYPNYQITAHGKKNYNQSASLNLEYPWM